MIPICVRADSNGEEEKEGDGWGVGWVVGGGSGWSVWLSVKKDQYAKRVSEFGTIKVMYACAVEPNDVNPFSYFFSFSSPFLKMHQLSTSNRLHMVTWKQLLMDFNVLSTAQGPLRSGINWLLTSCQSYRVIYGSSKILVFYWPCRVTLVNFMARF